MNLGITVGQVIEVKMGDYLNSLPAAERAQKKQEYIQAGQAAIQGDIDEAESLADSVQSTSQQVIESIPIWVTQIASIAAGIANPITSIPSVTALATMKQNISATKDTVTRAFSQVQRIMGILSTLGVTSAAIGILTNLLNTAQSGLDNIPEIEIPEPTPGAEELSNVHKYKVLSGNIEGMVMDSKTEYYLFWEVVEQLPQVVNIKFPANPHDGEVHILKIDYSTNQSGVDFVIQANYNQYLALQLSHQYTYDLLHRGDYAHYIFVDRSRTWVRIY